MKTFLLLALVLPLAAQYVPPGGSGGGGTGTVTHTAGALALGEPVEGNSGADLLTVPAYIDGSTLTGADFCAKVNAGWTALALISTRGGIVDMRAMTGTQACAGDLWTNYPSAGSGNDSFNGVILGAPNTQLQLSDTTVMPGGSMIEGNSPHALSAPTFTSTGFVIGPSNSFPAGHPIVQYGISRTNNPEGIQLRNLGVTCTHPNGSFDGASTGIINKFAQENSGGKNVDIIGCESGLDIEPGGDDSGPFDGLHVSIAGGDATAHCVDIGTTTAGSFSFRGIRDFSCVGQSSGTQQNVGVYINGSNTLIESAHIEQFVTGIQVANAHFVQGLSLTNIGCQGGGTFTMTTCIDIASGQTPTGYFVNNVRALSASTTNLLVDHTNASTILATENTIGTYGCGAAGQCWSTSPSAPALPNSYTQFPNAPFLQNFFIRQNSYLIANGGAGFSGTGDNVVLAGTASTSPPAAGLPSTTQWTVVNGTVVGVNSSGSSHRTGMSAGLRFTCLLYLKTSVTNTRAACGLTNAASVIVANQLVSSAPAQIYAEVIYDASGGLNGGDVTHWNICTGTGASNQSCTVIGSTLVAAGTPYKLELFEDVANSRWTAWVNGANPTSIGTNNPASGTNLAAFIGAVGTGAVTGFLNASGYQVVGNWY